jgi:hypothetical protein
LGGGIYCCSTAVSSLPIIKIQFPSCKLLLEISADFPEMDLALTIAVWSILPASISKKSTGCLSALDMASDIYSTTGALFMIHRCMLKGNESEPGPVTFTSC